MRSPVLSWLAAVALLLFVLPGCNDGDDDDSGTPEGTPSPTPADTPPVEPTPTPIGSSPSPTSPASPTPADTPESPSPTATPAPDLDQDDDGYPSTGGGATATDCDDTDPSIHPGAQETAYDDVDQDCDGADLTDVDEDDYDAVEAGGTDCDDGDVNTFPEAEEIGDGADNDCDGQVDEGVDTVDNDGDGYAETDGDCDDADPSIHPDATEVPYDDVDQDCSGLDLDDVDGDGWEGGPEGSIPPDCDDSDPSVHPEADEVPYDGVDQDCLGGDATDLDGDGFPGGASGSDCDDQDPAVNPGAAEVPYDDVDQDCDGSDLIDVDGDGQAATEAGGTDCDDEDPSSYAGATETPYDDIDQDCSGSDLIDVDGDGYSGTGAGGGDCDDANTNTYPGAPEFDDDQDNDCDGQVDEALDTTDDDGDGYAEQGSGSGQGDCNDGDASIYPGAAEVPYDGVDQDCSGTDLVDVDGDGVSGAPGANGAPPADCDDADASIYPGATETAYDGVDQDCSSGDLVDVDGDGYAATVAGGQDCDDSDPFTHPGATETAYDGVDQDCSGADLVDVDGDGYAATAAGGPDCNDANAAIHPAAAEVCDKVDNNCDGVVDTDAVDRKTFYEDGDHDGYGDPARAVQACAASSSQVTDNTDCNDADASIHPGASEACNGIDDDCDGTKDEGVQTTFYRDADGDGFGNASSTTAACSAPSGYVANATDCDDTSASSHPGGTESCDGKDNDCDGVKDDVDADGDGAYGCSGSTPADCDDTDADVYPGATETCNGVDDDCDGTVDVGSSVCSLCANATCPVDRANALSAEILKAKPTAYWPLDETSGTTAFDKSGNGRNGTYGGVVTLGQTGWAGAAANFGGKSWVSTTYPTSTLMTSTTGSVTAVVKVPSTFVTDTSGYASNYIPHVFSNDAWYMGASVGTYKGVTGVHFWSFYTGSLQDVVSIPVEANAWVHIAWVLGGGKLYGYVNGLQQYVTTHGATASMGVFGMARMFQSGSTIAPTSLYPSQIQHVATYNIALTPQQVRAQAQAAELMGDYLPYRSCQQALSAGASTGDGIYWLDPDGSGTLSHEPFWCDMSTDGGGWTKLESARWTFFFTTSNWSAYNEGDPRGESFSNLQRLSLFADTDGAYTLRFQVGNSGTWTSGNRAHYTLWQQKHNPFTATTDGSDFHYIGGELSTTCSGFNGLHHRYQAWSMATDADSVDNVNCWYMQVVPTVQYPGYSGYLEGYGGPNSHVWQSFWVR